MKVLVCHNFYQQPGGEDQVFAAEMALLREMGDEVIQFTRDNKAVEEIDTAAVAVNAVWSRETYEAIRALVRRERPEIVHFHNTFPLMSPAAYYAARAEGAAVVHTLHNYRLLCPAATFFRDGHVCEECLGKAVPWPGVLHACYRNSPRASAAVAAILTVHGAAQTWSRAVDRFIALTQFSRRKFVEGGLPTDRIVIKPNFVHPDPGQGPGDGGYAAFVGRLSVEKGIDTMLKAWKLLPTPIKLKIVGDGPLAPQVREAAAENPNIEFLGRLNSGEVYEIVGAADFLVFPSVWYEGQPRTLVEAFALGTPVVASRLGSMLEMIEYGRTGLHFRAGDPADLAGQVARLTADRESLIAMRGTTRAEFESHYTAQENYRALRDVYAAARANYEATGPAEFTTRSRATAIKRPLSRSARKFKVLLAHNYYRLPGGEDNVFADEARLLEENGHEVFRFLRDNKNVEEIDTAIVAAAAVWSRESYGALRATIRAHRPDVVHFHNTFPLMSPAAYYAARAEGAAVVQTLHNYRLLCPSATFYRDGHVCEDCLGKIAPWPGVLHACYRGSIRASAAVAAMLTIHGAAHTWDRAVDRYIALTDFSRGKFIEGGLPADRIVIKPNFVAPDPGEGDGRGGFALFVGTLVDGKGVLTMLRAWDKVAPNIRLKIIGDGPLAEKVRKAAQQNPAVQFLGRRPLPAVYAMMREAACLVFPSLWYEGLPKTIVESFACGTPVIASNIGAMASLITHGQTGLHFRPGDEGDLAAQVKEFMSESHPRAAMRTAARNEYLTRYTSQANYQELNSIYAAAIEHFRSTSFNGNGSRVRELRPHRLVETPIAQ
jgi:glycosyltransferase involved in cell wall biosynthesis